MVFRVSLFGAAIAGVCCCGLSTRAAVGQDDTAAAQVRTSAEQLAEAFRAGKTDEIVASFLPHGELIDEHGNVYQGQKEIHDLLSAYFAKYPGAKLAFRIDSIRLLGPVAVEEGTRDMQTSDGSSRATVRYLAVRTKTTDGWRIASIRDFADHPAPTPHQRLQPLGWLVGEWVNEGTDGVVNISIRWSEDENFLLGEFLVNSGGRIAMKSSQRIGWDPLTGKVRSWLFDSDGGFGEATWTQLDDAWVMKSSAVLPDGLTGSATVTVTPISKDRFAMKGTERIVGDGREDDFELTITRRPPQASTEAQQADAESGGGNNR